MYKKILFLFFICVNIFAKAQLDLEHWFPPYFRTSPNVITDVSLYLSTDKEEDVSVKLFNNNILLTEVKVSKNSPIEIPITTYFSMIEASTPVRTMKANSMGFHLSGEKSFYASLRFMGCKDTCKNEVVASKGKTALGKDFFIVTDQNILYGNNPNGMLYQASVMATQDNTHVKVSNYGSGLKFIDGNTDKELNINLNKDESYIIVARKEDNPNPPVILDDWDPNIIGARITSDKPVVINNGNFTSQNLGEAGAGVNYDQSVPVDRIGKEYFLINGMTKTEAAMEKAIIVATKDNTQVFFNDETQPTVTLNKGEHFIGPYGKRKFLDGNQPFFKNPDNGIIIPTRGMYIKSNEPIYVYQLIGGYNYLIQGPSPDFTQHSSGMTFSHPIDKDYCPKPLQNLKNIVKIPMVNKIGSYNLHTKLSIKTPINANLKVNGQIISNASPMIGKDGWGYYTIVPASGDFEIESDKDLNVDVVGGFTFSGYASSYTGFSNDPYILVNGNCIQESVYLRLNNQDFISFQWQLNGVDIPGANNSGYQPLVEGNYQCVVTYTGFSFTTASVFIPNCPYNIYDINIGNVCHNFEIDTKFTQPGHVFSKLEILTQPNNGNADISNRKVIVKVNDSFTGNDRLIYKITANDGYYEVYKANFTILPNPIADIKTELQPKYFLDDTYYFDLYSIIINDNNETFEFYPSQNDADKRENQITDLLSNYSEPLTEVYVRITNQYNCYIVKKVILVRPPIVPDSVSLPNVFSPNNDGINDIWDYSLLKAFENVELKIYDRYGKLLYTHSKYFFWDGKINNKVLPSESYWVIYSYTSKGVRVSNKSMWVLLKNK
ncbi:T9SS type B sorting domain-containing protein [Epilithonimonas tenax]|uniref:T9SS type B sorting domain-containing protein n=1 Tax=Epilithonimonas tenax TaxID=191577 RepID=UPI0003FA55EC|nr:T9SS type B sorting domain-containing protein [Epilithonimonas tenax]